MTVFITGTAGFIGNTLAWHLLCQNRHVVGLDNFNPYYSVELKRARVQRITHDPKRSTRFTQYEGDLTDAELIQTIMKKHQPDTVIHLAAQAGVGYSMTHPETYVASNLVGFFNILEACRQNHIKHLIFASTSSVYGANRLMPFTETQSTDHPLSFYAATKKSNELMAHSYSAMYQIPMTGVRFFTVYGPWGRPDMAMFKFSKAMLANEPIDVYNHGHCDRDFTYVDDIVQAIDHLIPCIPSPITFLADDEIPALGTSPVAPFQILNIGRTQPVNLMECIGYLEQFWQRKAKIRFLPLPASDVPKTWADCSKLSQLTQYQPQISLKDGVKQFVQWYREFYTS